MTAMVVYPCYLTIMLMLFLNLAYPASWFLFDVAPAILQIPSALPHSHRRPECPAGCIGQWPRSDVVEWLCYWSAFSFGSKNPSVRSVSFKLLVTLLLSIRRRLCAFHHTPSNSVTKSHIPFLSIPGELKESKHRECGHTPVKSPFSACCRSGDFSCWEYPKPSLDCFANNTLKLDVSTRYLQKIVERFQVAWYDKDAMKQKEVVSNDKTQRSAAPCKASGLRRLHGVKLVA